MSSTTATSNFKLNSGYDIPVIGLGVYEAPPEVTTDIVYKALKVGYRHFDTAEFYQNEKEVVEGIMKFLKENPEVKREDIFYTTKLAVPFFGYDNAKVAIAKSIEAAESLGYIDLFLVHAPIGNPETRIENYKALQEFVSQGKIRSIGVSNYAIHHLKELLEWPGLEVKPAVNQIELHPWLTRKELIDYMDSVGIKGQAFSPLVRGMKMDDEQLIALAKKYNATPAQILTKWSLEKGFLTLPKTVTESRLKENLDALKLDISKEDVVALTHDDEYVMSNGFWDPSTFPDWTREKLANFGKE